MANQNNIVVIIAAQDNSGAVLKQLEESLSSLKSKANESGDAMLAVGTKAAALATAAAIAAKAVGELGSAVSGALDVGTQLDNLSKKTGLSAETLSVLRYTAKLTGEDFESTARAVTKLDKSIAEAAAGNKEDAALFAQLGLNVKELATAPDGAEVAMRKLGQALADTSGPNKQGAAMKLLGRNGAETLPVLEELATNWDYFRSRAASAGELLSGPQAAALAESNRKLADLKLQVDGAALAFAQGLLPGLNATLNVISGGKGSLEGLVEIGHGIGRSMAFAASAVYGLASGLSRLLELQAIAPSWRKALNGHAEDFDKRSRDAMYFAVHGKEATPPPADPLREKSPSNGKRPLSLPNIEGAGKMESAVRERDAALAKLAEERAQSQFQTVKTAGDARLAELESQHARELISDQEFYVRKLAIQREELDAELKAATSKQAALDANIAELSKNARQHGGHFDIDLSGGAISVARGHQGDPEAVSDEAKIAELLTRRLQLSNEIAKINADGAKAEYEYQDSINGLMIKRTELVDELAAKREAITGGSVEARLHQSADTHDIKRKGLAANFGEGSKEVSDADFAFGNEQGQIRAKGAEETSGLATAGINAQRTSIQDALDRGSITTVEAQKERISLDQEEAKALGPVLQAYEELAASGDLQATEKVTELKTRISELSAPVDEVAQHMRESFDGAFESLFENLDQGVKSFESFTQSVARLLEQATYKKFIEPLVQMELGKLIPNDAPGTPAYGDAGIGGAHALPGTSIGGAVKTAASIGSALGIPGVGELDKKGNAGAITITLVNEGGLPLKIGDIKTGGSVDKDQVLSVIQNSFEEGGLMRSLLTGFGALL